MAEAIFPNAVNSANQLNSRTRQGGGGREGGRAKRVRKKKDSGARNEGEKRAEVVRITRRVFA